MLPERNCAKCTASQKLQWGCDADAKLPLILDGEELKRCPRRPILEGPEFYGDLFWLYRSYQKGFLPEEGNLHSQPAALMEMFRIIDRTLDTCEQARREKEAKRKRRGGPPPARRGVRR